MIDFHLYVLLLAEASLLLVPAVLGFVLHHTREEMHSPATRQVSYFAYLVVTAAGAVWALIVAFLLTAVGFWNLFLVPILLLLAARGGWSLYRRTDPKSPYLRPAVIFLYAFGTLALTTVLAFLLVQVTGRGLDTAPSAPPGWMHIPRG